MLRWVQAGSGEPAVILSAALAEPGTLVWASVLPEVARHTRVIAYDRAGIGTSDPATPLTLDSQVADLIALAAQAGGGCVLTGHSWGGMLVQLAALQRPDLVSGLVLADPSDETYSLSLPAQLRAEAEQIWTRLEELYARGEQASMTTEAFEGFARRQASSPELQSLIIDAFVACYQSRFQIDMVRLENELFTSSIPLISAARDAIDLPDVPLVVLSATRTDGDLPADYRRRFTQLHAELAAAVPGGRHILVPDTGHAINEEQPQAITDAIMSVISQVRENTPI